jgi:hypothetical protein
MDDIRKRIDDTVSAIKRERDELQLKLSLAKLEAGDEWKIIETKLATLEDKARELGKVAGESSQDIGAAAKLLAEEIRDGFKKIGRHI